MGGLGPDGCTRGGPVSCRLGRRAGPPLVQPRSASGRMAALVEVPFALAGWPAGWLAGGW